MLTLSVLILIVTLVLTLSAPTGKPGRVLVLDELVRELRDVLVVVVVLLRAPAALLKVRLPHVHARQVEAHHVAKLSRALPQQRPQPQQHRSRLVRGAQLYVVQTHDERREPARQLGLLASLQPPSEVIEQRQRG